MESNTLQSAFSLTADWVSAVANIGLLVTAIITAYLALQSMRQARDIEQRANRPMMVAEVVAPDDEVEEVGLRVKNVGRTVAKNVRVSFDPALPEPDLKKLNTRSNSHYYATNMEALGAIFGDRVFLTWTPGMEVTAKYWAAPKNFNPWQPLPDSAEGVPPEQKVIIHFEDELGKTYRDEYVLDIHTIIGLRFRDSEFKKIRKAIETVAKYMSSTASEVGRVAEYMHRSPEQIAAESEERRQKALKAIEYLRRLEVAPQNSDREKRDEDDAYAGKD